MIQPLIVEGVRPRRSLDDCLNSETKWLKTQDPTALWQTQVGAENWTVRVNDFPEDHLYTLFVNDEELGSFDEWPRPWSRAAEVVSSSAVEPRTPTSHITTS
jgi:hypothetical protein